MVNKICELKDKLLERVENDMQERGVERIDVKEMGELIDMVKDLAEAEGSLWEAEYHREVVKAMKESSGYSTTTNSNPASGGGNMGYGNQGGNMRQGYGMSNPRQGYGMGHHDLIDKLGEEFKGMNPEERMMMRNKVLSTLGNM